MQSTMAKPRVAPESMASHHTGFALRLIEMNTREVFMNKILKICAKHVRHFKQKRGIGYHCKQCDMESQQKTYLKYREERLERARKYREENREKLSAWARDDRARNKAKYALINKIGSKGRDYPKRLLEILKSHGLTKDQYDEMILTQENKCAICRKDETCKDPRNDCVRRLSIDHNHETGKVRQLLCHACNTGIGKFKENIELMKQAILYLENHES